MRLVRMVEARVDRVVGDGLVMVLVVEFELGSRRMPRSSSPSMATSCARVCTLSHSTPA